MLALQRRIMLNCKAEMPDEAWSMGECACRKFLVLEWKGRGGGGDEDRAILENEFRVGGLGFRARLES